eukprot:768456-Hanusia_phi.AAC.13
MPWKAGRGGGECRRGRPGRGFEERGFEVLRKGVSGSRGQDKCRANTGYKTGISGVGWQGLRGGRLCMPKGVVTLQSFYK